MRYMYKCDKVFKVHIYSLSCKILPIASVMVTDRFLHRECNLWGRYIIQVHPPRNLPSGTWVHIFRVLFVRSLPIASVSSVYQGIDLQYKKHEYGQTLVEYAITWSYNICYALVDGDIVLLRYRCVAIPGIPEGLGVSCNLEIGVRPAVRHAAL